MARVELLMTRLPNETPGALAALPSAIDARMLKKALRDKELPTAAVAVSDRRAPIEAALAQLRALGGDGYLYEKSTLIERATWLLEALVARVRPGHAAAAKPEPLPFKPDPVVAPVRVPWRLIGGVVSVLVMAGVADTMLSLQTALDDLETGPSRLGCSQSQGTGAAPARASSIRKGSDRNAAEAHEKKSPETAARLEPSEPARTARAPSVGPAIMAALSAAAERARGQCLVLLPLLLGVVLARWLVHGAQGYVTGQRSVQSAQVAIFVPVFVLLGATASMAIFPAHRAALPKPKPGAATTRHRRAPVRHATAEQRARLASLIGPSALVALAAAPMDAHDKSETTLPAADVAGSLPPRPARPFLGLLQELRRRKAERAQTGDSAAGSQKATGKDAAVQTAGTPSRNGAAAQTAGTPSRNGAAAQTDGTPSPKNAAAQTDGTPSPPSSGPLATTGAISGSTFAGSSGLAAANPTMGRGAGAQDGPRGKPIAPGDDSVAGPDPSQVAPISQRLRSPRLSSLTPIERAVYAYATGFVVALLFYGLRWVLRLRRDLRRARR